MKNKNKGFITAVFFTIISIVIIGFSSYYYIENRNIKDRTQEEILATSTNSKQDTSSSRTNDQNTIDKIGTSTQSTTSVISIDSQKTQLIADFTGFYKNDKETFNDGFISVTDNLSLTKPVDENTKIILKISAKKPVDDNLSIRFSIVRDLDNTSFVIDNVNLAYIINNTGVYEPNLKSVLVGISHQQASSATYHIQIDIPKEITVDTNKHSFIATHIVNTNRFKIISPEIKSSINIINPGLKDVLHTGQSYIVTWTGSASSVSSYTLYLVGSDPNNPLYLGTTNSNQNSFNLKVPTNTEPGVYQINIQNKDKIIAYGQTFTITNNANYSENSSSDLGRDTDALIKSGLKNLRSSITVEYDVNQTGNSTGFCNSKVYTEGLKKTGLPSTTVCKDTAAQTAISAPVPSGGYWCVDFNSSNGIKINTPITKPTCN
jgi:hypothetical protein